MNGSIRRFLRNISAVAYREASVLRHDKGFLPIVSVQPIMMLLLFGYALSNKPANVPWAILDQSQTATSRKIREDVQATGYFLPPRAVASYDEGQKLLKEGKALAFLVIPASLRRDIERGRPQVQLLLDGSDPLSAARVGAYIGQVAAVFDVETLPPRNRVPDDRVRLPGWIDLRQRFWFNPALRDRAFFLAAMAGMLLTNFCLSVTSLGLVGERENGTYEQMLSLPTTAIEIVLGKLLPYVVISYGLLLFSVVAPGLVFGLWPKGSWLALVLVTLSFVLASLAVGVFVSTLARTSVQAVFIGVFFIMPSMVLSGVILPYQFMPPGIRDVGGIFPLRWYQIALRRIIERGANLADVVGPMVILLGLFGILLLVIRWRMKPRLG